MSTSIKINSLEEVAMGNVINGEIILSHRNNKVETLKKDLSCKKYDYVLIDNTLLNIGGVEISKKKYNYYLNLIKQKTN